MTKALASSFEMHDHSIHKNESDDARQNHSDSKLDRIGIKNINFFLQIIDNQTKTSVGKRFGSVQ
jgi:hypothetical protein